MGPTDITIFSCLPIPPKAEIIPGLKSTFVVPFSKNSPSCPSGSTSTLAYTPAQLENVVMSVGPKEVGLYNKGEKVIERKVPLPVKWIKGLTTVQIYQSVAEKVYSFNRIQTLQLFQTLPKSSVKCDYYLVMRGQKPAFSPVKSMNAICIGGLHRLRLLEPLLPFADELKVFAHPTMHLSGTSSSRDSSAAPSPENPLQHSRERERLKRTGPK